MIDRPVPRSFVLTLVGTYTLNKYVECAGTFGTGHTTNSPAPRMHPTGIRATPKLNGTGPFVFASTVADTPVNATPESLMMGTDHAASYPDVNVADTGGVTPVTPSSGARLTCNEPELSGELARNIIHRQIQLTRAVQRDRARPINLHTPDEPIRPTNPN